MYIATERVRPLEGVLRDWTTGGALAGKGKGKEDWIGWGVRSISVSFGGLQRDTAHVVDGTGLPQLPSTLAAPCLSASVHNLRHASDGIPTRRI